MSEQTDASLVGEVLAGDSEAFCTLVRRYQNHAYGVALGVLADFHLALDAAQEAFLCAYCDLPKLKDARRFGAWMCGIARNTAFEIRRNWMRQETLARKAADCAEVPDPVPSSQQVASANEDRALVQRALLNVKTKDREALTLYYADGLSYVEICGFLGISQGTLKGRLQRGRAALRKELSMFEQTFKDNAPDDAFTRQVQEAIKVLGAKGPGESHLPSAWHKALIGQINRAAKAGDEGFRVNLAVSHSGSARQRFYAVPGFGLRRDDRSLRELERMLDDRSARVRRQALKFYAGRIHPEPSARGRLGIGYPAATSVPGLGRLLDRAADENFNVRLAAVSAIGAYRAAGDPRVTEALQKALDDPKHKVRHVAARILGVPCPGCGKAPQANK